MKFEKEVFHQHLKSQISLLFGRKRYIGHIIFWIAMLLWILFGQNTSFFQGFSLGLVDDSGHLKSSSNLVFSAVLVSSIFSVFISAGIIYCYQIVLVAYAKTRLQVRWIVIWNIILYMGIVLVFIVLAIKTSELRKGTFSVENYLFNFGIFWNTMIIFSLYLSIFYFFELYLGQKQFFEYEEVLENRLSAESQFLKSQINPHFLFNSINNIYSLSLKDDERTSSFTMELKQLVHYVMNDCKSDVVPLRLELEFLQSYFNLEKVRNSDLLDSQINIDVPDQDYVIAPLLLVNFIENAFKHGVKAGLSDAFIGLSIRVSKGKLFFELVNSIPEEPGTDRTIEKVGGIGLKNVKRRLALLYPRKHKLKIKQSKNRYIVSLNLQLQ